MSARKFSEYFEELEGPVRTRYQEKLSLIGEAVDDPYTFGPGTGISSALPDTVPVIEYPDILMNSASPYTI